MITINVLNDTADYYRFFDATPHAEFLYACVQKTIDDDLPRETDFLRCYDRFHEHIQNIVDMPDSAVDLLFRFLRQNGGKLAKRRRENEFARLTEAETRSAEEAFAAAFGLDPNPPVGCRGGGQKHWSIARRWRRYSSPTALRRSSMN